MTFSESVTGFDVSDIAVTNGTASNVQGSGSTYTFDVTPTADGDVTVSIPAAAAQDLAGNDNTAAAARDRDVGPHQPDRGDQRHRRRRDHRYELRHLGRDWREGEHQRWLGLLEWHRLHRRSEQFFDATSSDNFATWSLAFAPGGPFTVHAQATDAAGNVGENTNNDVSVT